MTPLSRAEPTIYVTTTPDEAGKAGDITWNFEKFLLAADGTVLHRWSPRTEPDDPGVVAAIEAALG